jgi:hypothetical protein
VGVHLTAERRDVVALHQGEGSHDGHPPLANRRAS